MVAVAVVLEVIVVPEATLVTNADKAEAVVYTAVVAHVTSPIAAVPAVAAAGIPPPARRPERTLKRRRHPIAGDVIVPGVRVVPIAGGPEVVGSGSNRLLIVRQRWRRLLRDGNAWVEQVAVQLIVLAGVRLVGAVGLVRVVLLRGLRVVVIGFAARLTAILRRVCFSTGLLWRGIAFAGNAGLRRTSWRVAVARCLCRVVPRLRVRQRRGLRHVHVCRIAGGTAVQDGGLLHGSHVGSATRHQHGCGAKCRRKADRFPQRDAVFPQVTPRGSNFDRHMRSSGKLRCHCGFSCPLVPTGANTVAAKGCGGGSGVA